jgi:ketosteroid isomerase-like protein
LSTSRDEFDPLAVVADWLDAFRSGELNARLDLYDERATLECDCEGVTLSGRKSIAAYWAPKLQIKTVPAFTLEDMTLTGDGGQLDYQKRTSADHSEFMDSPIHTMIRIAKLYFGTFNETCGAVGILLACRDIRCKLSKSAARPSSA